jgi:hypothetical protein
MCERLVEQQHARIRKERARDGHALALASGKRTRQPAQERIDVHRSGSGGDAGFAIAPVAQCKPQIRAHAHAPKERVVLKNDGHETLLRRHAAQRAAIEPDVARVRLEQAGDGAQQRRLAGTGGSDDRERTCRFDAQTDPVERAPRALGIGNDEILDVERTGARRFTRRRNSRADPRA